MPAPLPQDSWWEYLQAAALEVYTYSLSRQGLDPRGPPGPLPPSGAPTCGPSKAQFDAFWGQQP